jgi:hypothetical protein
MRKSANRPETDNKRKAPKTAWKPGVSGNPAGRPKDGESWAAIIAAVGNMYPDDLIKFIGRNNDLGRMLIDLPQNVQMKYLVTARVFAALMFEPTSGLWKELMERVEGKVADHIDMTSGGEKLSNLSDEEKILRIVSLVQKANNAKS